jgi:hypothetical protein
MFARLLSAFVLLLWLAPAAQAGEVSQTDAQEFQRIIAGQIAALNADDGQAAFSHASPMIQRMFQTTDNFMAMVKNGYQPVYRQKSYTFREAAERIAGLPTQEVTILDANGKTWTAVYTMQKQPDGAWKINGCTLVEVPGADA